MPIPKDLALLLVLFSVVLGVALPFTLGWVRRKKKSLESTDSRD
jgi:hypothetical protein